jgi:hypothetical protein
LYITNIKEEKKMESNVKKIMRAPEIVEILQKNFHIEVILRASENGTVFHATNLVSLSGKIRAVIKEASHSHYRFQSIYFRGYKGRDFEKNFLTLEKQGNEKDETAYCGEQYEMSTEIKEELCSMGLL